ncbi:hypothetical protein IAR55_004492 [Kwoniella newhampshirensis]|uniref:BTB domain-containing protein n=1 Tax=Kwoniella newhampshirensis TaxID=1651941 RepID=A0AAW0YNL3_9TREE
MPPREAACYTETPAKKRTEGNDQEEEVINDLNRPYQFPDADFTLLSSDATRFSMHFYQLKAASSVFRSMLDGRKDDEDSEEITLTDKTVERSQVIAFFLDLVKWQGNRHGSKRSSF